MFYHFLMLNLRKYVLENSSQIIYQMMTLGTDGTMLANDKELLVKSYVAFILHVMQPT